MSTAAVGGAVEFAAGAYSELSFNKTMRGDESSPHGLVDL